ncbi:MAG TPA: hypothetical protein VFM54_04090 [Micromonosporaceae bacterium]|nr:hypothetical protein [Micromonosporaceae bacterium]
MWKIVSSRYGVLLAVLTVGALLAQVSGYSLRDLMSRDGASSPAQGSSSFSINVPGPGWCERTQVDLDGRSVAPDVEPTDDALGASVDFTYSGCDQGLTYRTVDGMGLGFGPPGTPTRAQCAEFARSRPLARPEPISSIKAGTALCAITSNKAVAWIKVTDVGSPYGAGNPETPPRPTLKMTVTLWR